MEIILQHRSKERRHSGEQENESIIRVRVGEKNLSLEITVCHHSASLVMPNGDPRGQFFYPALTLIMDSCILSQGKISDILIRCARYHALSSENNGTHVS